MIDVNSISYNEPAFFFNHLLPLFFFFFSLCSRQELPKGRKILDAIRQLLTPGEHLVHCLAMSNTEPNGTV